MAERLIAVLIFVICLTWIAISFCVSSATDLRWWDVLACIGALFSYVKALD